MKKTIKKDKVNGKNKVRKWYSTYLHYFTCLLLKFILVFWSKNFYLFESEQVRQWQHNGKGFSII